MTDRILRQAAVPTGAVVLPNANGTAPGLYLVAQSDGGKPATHLFLLPGPPRELCNRCSEESSLCRSFGRIVPRASLMTVGRSGLRVGESVVEAAVGAQLLALPDLELGYCARPGEVDVRVLGSRLGSWTKPERLLRQAFPLRFSPPITKTSKMSSCGC